MTTLIATPPAGEPRRQAVQPPHGMTSAMATIRATQAVVTDADWQQITNYLKDAA